MPRLRAPKRASGAPPAALVQPEDAAWNSVSSTRRWYQAEGLLVPADIADGPLSRHRQAVRSWAVAVGFSRLYGDSARLLPDWAQVRAAGVPVEAPGCMRERVETTSGS